MGKALIFSLFILLLAPTSAMSFDVPNGYIELTRDSDDNSFFVHKKSIKSKGPIRYFWTISGVPIFTKKGLSTHSRSYLAVNCVSQEWDLLQITHLGDHGVLETIKYKAGEWEPVAPGSIIEAFAEFVCKKTK